MCWSNYMAIPIVLKKPLRVYKVGTLSIFCDFISLFQDYHGHFYHPYINSGKYKEVWKSGKYNNGIHISSSIFSKEIQGLIMLDKVLVINKNN